MVEEPSGVARTSDRRRGIGAEPTRAVAFCFDRAPASESGKVSPAPQAARGFPLGCGVWRTRASSGTQLDRRP